MWMRIYQCCNHRIACNFSVGIHSFDDRTVGEISFLVRTTTVEIVAGFNNFRHGIYHTRKCSSLSLRTFALLADTSRNLRDSSTRAGAQVTDDGQPASVTLSPPPKEPVAGEARTEVYKINRAPGPRAGCG